MSDLKSSNELADDRTRMALSRTLVALDRTLLAWVRTATSLISFGFTIYKFFQALREESTAAATRHLLGPRGVALVLMSLGVGGLIVALIEYRGEVQRLHHDYAGYGPFRRSLAAGVALVICLLGVVGFVLVFLRQ